MISLALLALLLAQGEPAIPLEQAFEQTTITAVASAPACHRLDVYLAVSHEQRKRGLMFVRRLPPRAGMLFIYERDAYLSIWMKNTFIPLDIIFVRADGSVANIHENAETQSERSIVAVEPVRYVVELNAGASQALGIDTDSYFVLQAIPD